jgi:hypothetical protein
VIVAVQILKTHTMKLTQFLKLKTKAIIRDRRERMNVKRENLSNL